MILDLNVRILFLLSFMTGTLSKVILGCGFNPKALNEKFIVNRFLFRD